MHHSVNQLIDNRFQSYWNGNPSELLSFKNDLAELTLAPSLFDPKRFDQYSLPVTLYYLKESHAFYQSFYMPKMEQAIASLRQSMPESHAIQVLALFFSSYKNEFLEHVELEERKLFPYAEALFSGKSKLNYSVALFNAQHDHEIEDQLTAILQLMEEEYFEITQDFAFRSFKNLLEVFRLDIEIHHRIEEGVFLKKLENLEKML